MSRLRFVKGDALTGVVGVKLPEREHAGEEIGPGDASGGVGGPAPAEVTRRRR